MPARPKLPLKTVILTPSELAELLGIDTEDVGLITSANVRLPATWPEEWQTRLGPLELTTTEVGMILGRSMRTVQDWIREYGLAARPASKGDFGISPAALIEFLRERAGGKECKAIETPRQISERAARSKALALKTFGGE